MSTTDVAASTTGGQIQLPPGVTVGAGRQTSQVSSTTGAVVQGTLFPITLASGTTSSVFVPDTILANPDQVAALFNARVTALQAIPIG